MNIDLATFGIILAITHLILVMVFTLQFIVAEKKQGVGWWLLWSITEVVGFTAMALRVFRPLVPHAIFVQNCSIFIGTLFIYTGLMQFLGRRLPWRPLWAVSLGFLAAFGWYVYFADNSFMRSVIFNGSIACSSFAAMYALLRYKTPAISKSALFSAIVFFAHGSLFLCRTVLFFRGAPVTDFFASTSFNYIPYLDGLVVSLLWTFGFIIMLNQRLESVNREDRENLELIFDTSPDAVLITRLSDGVIVKVNAGFTALTGYTVPEAMGKTIMDIGIWTEQDARQKLLSALGTAKAFSNLDFVFRRKDGSRFTGLLSARIINLNGESHIISVTHDISLRKEAEDRVAALLAEKELILTEVHHRIKNNMNTITGLLSIQAGTLTDPVAVQALNDAESRVQSMAILYDILYKAPDFREISLARYFPPLIDQIISNFPVGAEVRIEKQIDDIVVDVKRIQPLGIILNELLTNIMKYAFVGKSGGIVRISASLAGSTVTVVIEDNGNGMPESVDFSHSTGFGLVLVHELTRQIRGKIRIERVNGTRIVLEFTV